ncbi:MAG: aminoacyl-tRNA hydrolase [Proteobacteria bacterium]|nr:aminoacyl-tRNA hydrolase [Pseudomonadota bacterium]
MRFIVGLGNPGLAYRVTRHNVGFMVVDRLARKHGISLSRIRFRARFGEGEIAGERAVLFKPQTYVNLSGFPVKDLLRFYEGSLDRLIVVHDDLDLNFGRIRIVKKGGHGGHKGVESILETLRRSDFTRLKIGIGRPQDSMDVKDYVLRPFDKKQKAYLGEILLRAVESVEAILLDGVERAMNVFNVGMTCEKKSK